MQRVVWPHYYEGKKTLLQLERRAAKTAAAPCYRRVRCLPARHSSAATTPLPLLTPLNKINTRYLWGQATLLWNEFYFPNSKACAIRTVGNVYSSSRKFVMFPLLELGCSNLQIPRLCGRADIYACEFAIVSPPWALIPQQSLFLIGESHWGGSLLDPQLAVQCAKELQCATDAHIRTYHHLDSS